MKWLISTLVLMFFMVSAHAQLANPQALPLPATIPPVMADPNDANGDAAIQAAFPSTLLTNVMNNPYLDAQFGAASGTMVAWLSTEYQRNGGYLPLLLYEFATKLSAANLGTVRQSFGPVLDGYVQYYASASVAQAYFVSAPFVDQIVEPGSSYSYQMAGMGAWVQPYLKMSQTDMWWEEFAKPGATVQSAILAVAMRNYTAYEVAWSAGYYIGGKLVLVLDAIDPNINLELGNAIGPIVDGVVTAVMTANATAYVDLPGFYDAYTFDDFAWENTWWDWTF